MPEDKKVEPKRPNSHLPVWDFNGKGDWVCMICGKDHSIKGHKIKYNG